MHSDLNIINKEKVISYDIKEIKTAIEAIKS